MKPEVAPILATLVEAIQNTGTETRMLITCRYEFASDLLKRFFLQGLEPFQTAHEALHPFWGHRENESAEQWRELFRLKFANQDNPERFRQGFSQMLAVQYNAAADRGFEVELRSWKAELSDENLCDPLEVWLSQEDWRRADEETAWLFYVVMVRQGFEDWAELFKSFPTDILNEIDRVWVTYSQEHFGFSVQKCIWEGVGGKENANHITIREFGKQVGWYVSNNWRSYNTLSFSPESQQGNLPALPHTQPKDSIRLLNRWGNVMPLTKWVDLGGSPFDFAGYFNDSLLSRQDLTYNKWAFQTSCQA